MLGLVTGLVEAGNAAGVGKGEVGVVMGLLGAGAGAEGHLLQVAAQ